MFDPITLLAAFAPVAVEAGKAAVQRWLAPDQVKPASVDDMLKMENAKLEWFKSITNADSGGETYRWVEAIRKLQRPLVVFVTLVIWGILHVKGGIDTTAVDNAAAAVSFYLFGDRTMLYIKKVKDGKQIIE